MRVEYNQARAEQVEKLDGMFKIVLVEFSVSMTMVQKLSNRVRG